MASYQTRRRAPLLDRTTQEMVERRSRELLGLALLVLGAAVALMLSTYSHEDPGWMVATDEPARNALGRLGAAVASTLVILCGVAAWGIAAVLVAWGGRFLFHRGQERALARLPFAVIAVALAAVFAATHVPGAGWPHAFGLGGLFGDTVLGALIGLSPFGPGFGLRLAALATGALTLAGGLFVLGFDRAELAALRRYLWVGLIVAFNAGVLAVEAAARTAGRTARAGARGAAAGIASRKLARPSDPYPATGRGEAPGAPARRGLRAIIPSLSRRTEASVTFEPELVETPASARDIDAPSPERIRTRIAEAIGSRGRAEPPLSARAAASTNEAAGFGAEAGIMDPSDDDDDEDAAATELRSTIAPAGASEARRVIVPPARRAGANSRRADAEAQPRLRFDDTAPGYEAPALSLLAAPKTIVRQTLSTEALEENARMLENVLDDYGVKGEITSVRPGPVVTMYELEPAPGLKASRVIGLSDDIARSMSALSARVSTVPGRTVIGIELPNAEREKVYLREILAAREFGDSTMRLPLALGKDIGGAPVVANLAKMPHLLIAGTTGSGKSVAINTMILSLLYKLSPEECRLIMIDPKMLELSVYDGIPHLLSPVVTDPKKAVVALKWVVAEMEERYRKMSRMGVRNIEGFNGRVREALERGEMFRRTVQTGFDDETADPVFETEEFAPVALPYIVVIVDEMADLMMVAGKEIEACIQRLAQMARASGIHLIMATQRPSVDVITGTIKANFPTRISFQVTSKIDSRTILGEQGAEQLLGMGDMLYMAGGARITRIHGPFVSDEEVEEVVTHLKSFGPPEYLASVVEGGDDERAEEIDAILGLGSEGGDDALYDQAVAIVARDRKCSTSYIQRKLGIGYNKAARLVEQMENQGVVTRANAVGKREILVPEP
jgi:S-DNA-T family DNA segregation ATPase FtsK/SpoIIIE